MVLCLIEDPISSKAQSGDDTDSVMSTQEVTKEREIGPWSPIADPIVRD